MVKHLIDNVRETVKYLKSSSARKSKFSKLAKQMQVDTKRGLALDVSTRWNSTFLILESALVYKNVFERYQDEDPHYIWLPTMNEWEICENICDFLSVFYDTTLTFSGSTYPTSNFFLGELCAKAETNMNKVKATMLRMYNWYADQTHGTENTSIAVRRDTSTSRGTQRQSRGGRKIDEEDFLRFKQQVDVVDSMKSELDVYLEESCYVDDDSIEFNILQWWMLHRQKFRLLSKMARDVLSIQMTTVASESAFSTGGRVIDDHRSRLSPSTIEALICTGNWLREVDPLENLEDTDDKMASKFESLQFEENEE